MTPRQIRAETMLLWRRRLHAMARALVVVAQGTHGTAKETKRQIETWGRM